MYEHLQGHYFLKQNISQISKYHIRRRGLCLNCTYSTPFGFTSIRFQIFTQLQQDDQYVGYDHRTAELDTINVQTQ